MTTNVHPPSQQRRPPRSAASWRDTAMARSEIITDAWEVTKTYAGRIAEWVLFGCMIMNIIEILPGVTLWPALSNIVLGTQVVMLDVGGFSLASMGDHARRQGDEQAARRASLTGGFLIGIMILTLLLVSIGLLWPAATSYTNVAEKGLILVRVIMTVIYGHVIHSLRRVATQPTPAQVEALAAAFNQQLQQLASELARVQENVHRRLASELATQRASLQQQLASELSPLHASSWQYEAQLEALMRQQIMAAHEAEHETREAGTTRQSEAPQNPREARKPASQRNHEANTKVFTLRQSGATPTEKKAAVYALLDRENRLSSYEIAEKTGYPPSTIQRYMKDWKAKQAEAVDEASDSAM